MSSANTYIVEFFCKDPELKLPVKYTLTIKTKPETVVRAPDLLVAIDRLASKPAYQEDLADRFKTQFPGQHILVGDHFGVSVRTDRQGSGT